MIKMGLNKECMYCMEDDRRDNLMIEIAQLDVSKVFLFGSVNVDIEIKIRGETHL